MTIPKWLRKTERERFLDKIQKGHPAKCWMWMGSIDGGEAGMFTYRGRIWKAHRLAYTLAKGPIPDGFTIDHLCRVRLCCNPAHLEAVTLAENYRRTGWTLERRRERYRELQGDGATTDMETTVMGTLGL